MVRSGGRPEVPRRSGVAPLVTMGRGGRGGRSGGCRCGPARGGVRRARPRRCGRRSRNGPGPCRCGRLPHLARREGCAWSGGGRGGGHPAGPAGASPRTSATGSGGGCSGGRGRGEGVAAFEGGRGGPQDRRRDRTDSRQRDARSPGCPRQAGTEDHQVGEDQDSQSPSEPAHDAGPEAAGRAEDRSRGLRGCVAFHDQRLRGRLQLPCHQKGSGPATDRAIFNRR